VNIINKQRKERDRSFPGSLLLSIEESHSAGVQWATYGCDP